MKLQTLLINVDEAKLIENLLNSWGQTGGEYGNLWDRINEFTENNKER